MPSPPHGTSSMRTSPSASAVAVSRLSLRRRRRSPCMTSRSTTTSIVWLNFLSSGGTSSSVIRVPSTATRVKPSARICSSTSRCSPLRSRTSGREHQEAGALGQRQHLVGDLLDALARDRPSADRAVGLADPGEQQAQVVVDLGDRRHGGARVAAGRLLVDRDRRRQALDVVDVRLVHLAEELAGVGREALDVPALPLGVEGVEGQARLAAARQAGDDDEVVPRDLDGDVPQVVLPGPDDTDDVGGCRA